MPRFLQAVYNLAHVVPVHLADPPAERLPFVGIRLHAEDGIGIAAALEMVVINDHGQVVKPQLRRKHCGFPDEPFLRLAVAKQHINLRGIALELERVGHPARTGNAVAERAAGHIHTGRLVQRRVPLQHPADAAEGIKMLFPEIARFGKRRVKRRAGMPL